MEFVYDGSSSSSSSNSRFLAVQGEEADMGDLRRGPWTVEEDLKLVNYISNHGEGRWNSLARCAGLKRTGKSCRLRWLNYLRPDVRRGNITPEEQLLILQLHSRWGNRWSKIAQHLPGRTDNEIKNYWRTRVQKHAKQLKCDVNSQRFKDVMRYRWIPRLVERIHANSGRAAATVPTTTTTAVTLYDDVTTVPTAAAPGDGQANEFMQTTKFTSPESSSVDTMGTTASLPSASPPMSDFADHVVHWGDDIPAALGFNGELSQEGLPDLDNGWGFGDHVDISDSFWSGMDDIWSLQQ